LRSAITTSRKKRKDLETALDFRRCNARAIYNENTRNFGATPSSPRKAFGAARRTTPFDQETNDKEQQFCSAWTFRSQRTKKLRAFVTHPTIEGQCLWQVCAVFTSPSARSIFFELELIQPQMAQKQMPRAEVY
jgi:hypothetical protein